MKLSMKQLSGILSAAALSIGGIALVNTTGCDEVAEQCGFACTNDKAGVAEGNFAITGNVGIDGFFKSVIGFELIASSVAANIKAEIEGITLAFGISPAELKADYDGDLAAALQAKFKAKLTIDAQPPKCEVDASFSAKATVDCQASAGCEVDPGKAEFECMGSCEVEVKADGSCEAGAEVNCEFKGPSIACEGKCEGTCSLDLSAGGTCEGSCNGECSGSTDAGGKCDGECTGSCELSGEAAASCSGSCSGSCTVTKPEGKCEANAKASCEVKGEAAASCSGSCKGEVKPPKVECEASASCEASAKADASFNATCTPPSVDVRFKLAAALDADAEAQFNFGIKTLRERLPALKASLGRVELVLKAAADLKGDGMAAIDGAIKAFGKGDVDLAFAYKLGNCGIADELKASVTLLDRGISRLSAQAKATADLGIGL